MVKMSLLFLVCVIALFVFTTGAKAQTCSDVAAPAALKAQALEQALFAVDPAKPQAVQQCTFCNLTGYQSCDSLHGNSCGPEGAYRRCYLLPPCYCEWSACTCSGGTWNCFY